MEYLTIPKLAQQFGLSDNTVRRYTRNYPQFFRKVIVEGMEQFEGQHSLKLVKRIKELSASGKRRHLVLADLVKEFEPIKENAEIVGSSVEDANVVQLDSETVRVFRDIQQSLNRIADALEKGGDKEV